MIQPEDIRRKAKEIYRRLVVAWLDNDESFFPCEVRGRKTPTVDSLAAASQSIRSLRDGSKERIGFGYTVEWREVNSRRFGRNYFPARILFTSREDLLRFVSREEEFAAFQNAAIRLQAEYPILRDWIRRNTQILVGMAADLDGLLFVLKAFCESPRPNRFARELPIPVDTKFIDRHEGLLREWLDLVLPPHTIRADEEHFSRRYGLRYAEPHLLVRFLDPHLQREMGFPCSELSLPLHTLADFSLPDATVFIVENKVNLLTLPQWRRGIALGGLGNAVTVFRYCRWLEQQTIYYWGDIDTEGFAILSTLRGFLPTVESFLMDEPALESGRRWIVQGTGRKRERPAHLTSSEEAIFQRCCAENLRLEQEHLPQAHVVAAFDRLKNVPSRGADGLQAR